MYVIGLLFSILSVVVYIIVNDKAQFVESNYVLETNYIFGRPINFFVGLFVVSLCSAFSYFAKYYIIEHFSRTTYDSYALEIAKGRTDIDNEEILNRNARIL